MRIEAYIRSYNTRIRKGSGFQGSRASKVRADYIHRAIRGKPSYKVSASSSYTELREPAHQTHFIGLIEMPSCRVYFNQGEYYGTFGVSGEGGLEGPTIREERSLTRHMENNLETFLRGATLSFLA